MTYVVTEACIRCKYMDCVEVCPVDCFYEGENMLVINPNECIDCGVCEPECPAEAIVPDTEAAWSKWLEVNATYSAEWPNLTRKRESPADADEHKGEKASSRNISRPIPARATEAPRALFARLCVSSARLSPCGIPAASKRVAFRHFSRYKTSYRGGCGAHPADK
jgi:ferredoxin